MVYGGVGLGKTHLVQAIGNHIKATSPERFVLYVSAEKFTNQFIGSIKEGKAEDFGNFYLQVDTLILDDVQFLVGKKQTQEIFFHIFNHLHQSGKQIVLTSDRPPKDLQGLEDRLLSRFKWGLTADVQSPDFETRVAIIHNKMEQDGIDLPPNHVIDYLANSVHTNVRELEGVIASSRSPKQPQPPRHRPGNGEAGPAPHHRGGGSRSKPGLHPKNRGRLLRHHGGAAQGQNPQKRKW